MTIIADKRTPWADRADELWEKEGYYCDYVAWQEWAAGNWYQGLDEFDAIDTIDLVGWYDLCCKAFGAGKGDS